MKIGILFMAYGTPAKEEEILPYFTDILGGKRPSDEMLNELTKRYRLIWPSPLAEISINQAAATKEYLEVKYPEHSFVAVNGYRHIDPFERDGIKQLIDEDVDAIIGFALTPQYAKHSTQLYHDAANKALEVLGSDIPYIEINEWHTESGIIEFWGNELLEKVQSLNGEDYRVIFSAHNLPARQTQGDVYQEQFEEMGNLISNYAEVPQDKRQWAWQSGHEGGPIEWMRPFLEQTVEENLKQGIKHIISVPIGFISDNLEIAYDLDIELKEEIVAMNGELHRLQMPNTDPLIIQAISDAISKKVDKITL